MKLLIAGPAVTLAAFVAFVLKVDHRLSTQSSPMPERRASPEDVYLIGDSWFAAPELRDAVWSNLRSRGENAAVISYAYPGKRSRFVYESYRSLPISGGKCVFSVGINDSLGRFGPVYYAYHVRLLAAEALIRGCAPSIVELPHIDQVEAIRHLPIWLKVRAMFYGPLFDREASDSVDEYRTAARSALAGARARFLNPDSVIGSPHTRPELWTNFSHLNARGAIALGNMIAAGVTAVGDAKERPHGD